MSNVPQAPQPEDNSLETFAGRNYARFALQHSIHCVPIDEVCSTRTSNLPVNFRSEADKSSLLGRLSSLHNEQTEERNFDQVNDLFNLLLGRSILPPLNLEDLDEPWILECGYGKGAWVDTILNSHTDAYVGFLSRRQSDFSQWSHWRGPVEF